MGKVRDTLFHHDFFVSIFFFFLLRASVKCEEWDPEDVHEDWLEYHEAQQERMHEYYDSDDAYHPPTWIDSPTTGKKNETFHPFIVIIWDILIPGFYTTFHFEIIYFRIIENTGSTIVVLA